MTFCPAIVMISIILFACVTKQRKDYSEARDTLNIRMPFETIQAFPKAAELNGIAYDTKLKALLVTGKFWPKAYLVRLH
jgi:glutamine cyclotransferase